MGGKARVGVGEGGARGGSPFLAVLQIELLIEGAHVLGEVLQNAVVVLGTVILNDHCPKQCQLPIANGVLAAFAQGVVLTPGDIVVIGEAHGNVVEVFPDVKAIGIAVISKPGHGGIRHVFSGEVGVIVVVVKQPVDAQKSSDGVVVHGGTAAHISGHADGVVELHDGAGHHAVECLNGGNLPEHTGVVQALVEVGAAFLQVGQVHILAAVEGVGDQVIPGVLRLGFAQGDEKDGVKYRNQGETDQSGAVEDFLVFAAEAEQVHHRSDGHQRDGHIAPEAGGISFQPVGDGLRAVHGFEGGHKAHHQGDSQGDGHGPDDGALPVDSVVFQSQHCGHGHHQGEHVVPSGVIGGVHHLEGGVEEGHQSHEEQDPDELFQPMLAAHLKPADDAGHAEQRQPRSQRGPFGTGIGSDVGPCGQIGREEEAAENVQIPLDVVVKDCIPAVDVLGSAVVLQHGHHRGHQQYAGKSQTQHSFQGKQQEILEAQLPAFADDPQEEVDHGEGDLSHKEVIVYHAANAHRQGEEPPPAGGHVLIQGGQQQGEEYNGLVEVVEENVVDGEAGEGVQHTGNQGGIRIFHIAPHVDKASQGGAGKLQNQQGAHQILHPFRGEGDGQPKEGTAQHVEAVRADEVGPQVGGVAPPHVAGADCIVSQAVEGHLLDVEVPVEEEASAVHHDEGDEHQKGQPQAQEKGLEVIILPKALFCIFRRRHNSEYLPIQDRRQAAKWPQLPHG